MNAAVGGACVCFVGGVYYYSSNKMKEDEISQIDTEINLHESGLKFTSRGELIGDVAPKMAEEPTAAQDKEGAVQSGDDPHIKKRRWWTLWLVKA